MLFLNWGNKSKKICDASIQQCKNCNNTSPFELKAIEKNSRYFFGIFNQMG